MGDAANLDNVLGSVDKQQWVVTDAQPQFFPLILEAASIRKVQGPNLKAEILLRLVAPSLVLPLLADLSCCRCAAAKFEARSVAHKAWGYF